MTNDMAGIVAHYQSARERGALITINHPFEEICPFTIDLKAVPFDCIEIWNGPMRESNLRAVGLWHSLLAAGQKIPLSAGSDYHRDSLFLYPGGPTICAFAASASAADILGAVKEGHAYAVFAPNGPTLEMTAGNGIPGDSVRFGDVKEMHVAVEGLVAGDVLRVVTATDSTALVQATGSGNAEATYVMKAPGFARVELLRAFLPGLAAAACAALQPDLF